MNTSQKLRALLLVSCLTGGFAHAGDPQPAPDVQALIALLNKLAAESAAAAETEPTAEPAPSPAPLPIPATPTAQPAPTPAPAPLAKATPAPASTTLRTNSLSTSGLTTSGALGGSGAAPVVRLSNDDWRALFTARPTTK
jgi:hypothetical protein